MSASDAQLILDAEQIQRKITRIAYEIYEHNFGAEQLIIAGVVDRGYQLAKRICTVLDRDSTFSFAQNNLSLIKVSRTKFTEQQTEVAIDYDCEQLPDRSVVLVDDVLNTGRTLAYCISPFLRYPIKKLETAVLVNRSHIQFPVSISYTGYALATTLQEHIEVVLDDDHQAVFLK